MSTTIKANLNSGSNGRSLAALKKHIATCILRWREKHSSKSKDKQQQNQPKLREENCFCQHQQNSNRNFVKISFKEYSFAQRTAVYCKSFNTKFQKFIAQRQRINKSQNTTNNHCEGPHHYGRRVEIVEKLLSSTLIAKTITEEKDNFPENRITDIKSCTANSTAALYEDKMTIMDITFYEVREEYPDLNSEVRSILTSRAQEGATISEIRADYLKLTGLVFPVYENVTEFLLTIPHVTAYCSERGTRIFNIKPIDKTKHIHDMVMQQKPQLETIQRPPTSNRYYYRERARNTNYQPLNWRQTTSRRLAQNNANLEIVPINNHDVEQQEQIIIPSTDNNLSRGGAEECFENNCFYQDNYNYLYNRICNTQQQEPVPSNHIEKCTQIVVKPSIIPESNVESSTALNTFNGDIQSYKNNINHLNNLYQLHHQQQNQYQQTLNNARTIDFRRSACNPYKTVMPISSRSSSPTVQSWVTNDSVYTESDYEAHLLDFLLLGDDFFLYLARMELRCKFKTNQRILQSGLCVSGQTIRSAIKRVNAMGDQRRSVILNIGSVDIMQGRHLIQIEHDFRELLLTMLRKGIKPILTTIAPLANYSHNNEVKRKLERFNNFIMRESHKRKLVVIDIWSCLVNEKGHVFFDCYQNEPRTVTGTSESYLFWNKIGRQRVLQLIESMLEY